MWEWVNWSSANPLKLEHSKIRSFCIELIKSKFQACVILLYDIILFTYGIV